MNSPFGDVCSWWWSLTTLESTGLCVHLMTTSRFGNSPPCDPASRPPPPPPAAADPPPLAVIPWRCLYLKTHSPPPLSILPCGRAGLPSMPSGRLSKGIKGRGAVRRRRGSSGTSARPCPTQRCPCRFPVLKAGRGEGGGARHRTLQPPGSFWGGISAGAGTVSDKSVPRACWCVITADVQETRGHRQRLQTLAFG